MLTIELLHIVIMSPVERSEWVKVQNIRVKCVLTSMVLSKIYFHRHKLNCLKYAIRIYYVGLL